MDFSLSEEQRLLVETARRFVRTELMPLEKELEEKRALDPAKARAIFEKSKALGLYAVNIPAEYGGGGLSAVDTCLAEEQFGHTTDILIRRAFGNVYEVLLLANDAQRERWLEPVGARRARVLGVLHGTGSGLRRRRHQDARDARRRWLAADRTEDLHQRRAVLGFLRRLGGDRSVEGREGHLAVHRRQGHAGLHHRTRPADDGARRHQPHRDVLRQRAARARASARAGRPRAQSRVRDARPHSPGADRRARGRQGDAHPRHDHRVCARAPPVRQADRRAAADPAIARRLARSRSTRRGCCCCRPRTRSTRGATRASASRW